MTFLSHTETSTQKILHLSHIFFLLLHVSLLQHLLKSFLLSLFFRPDPNLWMTSEWPIMTWQWDDLWPLATWCVQHLALCSHVYALQIKLNQFTHILYTHSLANIHNKQWIWNQQKIQKIQCYWSLFLLLEHSPTTTTREFISL